MNHTGPWAAACAMVLSAAVVVLPAPRPAAATSSTECRGVAPTYRVNAQRHLSWYGAQSPGSGGPVPPGRTINSTGWTHRSLFPGGDGVIYGFTDRSFYVYRHVDPTVPRSGLSGGPVGSDVNWSRMRYGWSPGRGSVFTVDSEGYLWRFLYSTPGRTGGVLRRTSRTPVGHGWSRIRIVASAGGSHFYALTTDDQLRWYPYDRTYGSGIGPSRVVGERGWGSILRAWSPGAGILYGVGSDGRLRWYSHGDYRGGAPGLIGSYVYPYVGWDVGGQVFADIDTCTARAKPADLDPNDIAAVKAVGRQMMRDAGWSDSQWPCLDELWIHESSWRWNADNPTSSAYGIPQALPGSKMASAGADWLTNPVTQIRWGLGYIDERYGSPCAAWEHFQDYHWYIPPPSPN